jgi:hypothetical protein
LVLVLVLVLVIINSKFFIGFKIDKFQYKENVIVGHLKASTKKTK